MLDWDATGDALHAPATLRNREPILAVLRRILPARGTVLEIASGSGEHAVYFAGALPELTWVPSDPEDEALRSIAAHRAAAKLANLAEPVRLDAAAPAWPIGQADAVVSINMIHIAPPAATTGMLAGAARVLAPGGCLYLYGPFLEVARRRPAPAKPCLGFARPRGRRARGRRTRPRLRGAGGDAGKQSQRRLPQARLRRRASRLAGACPGRSGHP